ALSDSDAVARDVGAGALVGLLGGVLLLITPELQPYGLWVPAGAVVGGAIAGWLTYRTREWPARRPALAPWRGVFVGAVAAQCLGVLATLIGLTPVAGLPLWGLAGGAFVGFGELRQRVRAAGWRGLVVWLLVVGLVFCAGFAVAVWN